MSRLINFDIDHHSKTRDSYLGKTEWWKAETGPGMNRCPVCWIRRSDCFCSVLDMKKQELNEFCIESNFHVLMYYHYMEVGRSANTAHLFEAICPNITQPVLFGEVEKEMSLVDDLKREFAENEPVTCVLYPSDSAVLLSEWLSRRPARCKDKPIRLVALDGTYPMARRQLKYLRSCCDVHGIPLPLVKLDLEEGQCKSAIAGIMSQPGKDKICTFQAVVMAMRQLGISDAFCDHLTADLEDWLAHILRSKVKFGKTSKPARRNIQDVDATPADYISRILSKHQPPSRSYDSYIVPTGQAPSSTFRSGAKQQESFDRPSEESVIFYPTTVAIQNTWPATDYRVHSRHIDIYLAATRRFSVYYVNKL